MPNGKMSTKISISCQHGVQCQHSIHVGQASVVAVHAKLSICTLKSMELSIDKYYENFASVSWLRKPQSIAEHSKQLLRLRDTIQREAEQHERKEMFEIDRQRQTHEEIDGPQSIEVQSALSERTRTLEHYMASVAEMTACLTPENVHLGKTDVASYQLQLFGPAGFPQIVGSSHILPPKKTSKSRRRVGRQASVLTAPSQQKADRPPTKPSKNKRDVNFAAETAPASERSVDS